MNAQILALPAAVGNVDLARRLALLIGQAMRQSAGLRLFAARGWYDFATPFFGAEYALKMHGIPQERITWKNYDAGHMMYVRDEDRAKLSADIRAFLRAR